MKKKDKEIRMLTMILKAEWFDKILGGEKKTEYRDNTLYWLDRLEGKFDQVTFINGYQPTSRRMTLEIKSIHLVEQSAEHPECFHIKLGKLISTKYCKKTAVKESKSKLKTK